jgi:hypothetical protein
MRMRRSQVFIHGNQRKPRLGQIPLREPTQNLDQLQLVVKIVLEIASSRTRLNS